MFKAPGSDSALQCNASLVADELTATGAGQVLMNDLLQRVRAELSWEVNDKYVQWNQTCQVYTFIVGLKAIPGKQ